MNEVAAKKYLDGIERRNKLTDSEKEAISLAKYALSMLQEYGGEKDLDLVEGKRFRVTISDIYDNPKWAIFGVPDERKKKYFLCVGRPDDEKGIGYAEFVYGFSGCKAFFDRLIELSDAKKASKEAEA